MVVTGFELVGLIGAAAATIDLVRKATTIIISYRHYDEQTESLGLRLSSDCEIMNRYLTALRNTNHSTALTNSEAELLVKLTTHSQNLEVRLRRKMDNLPAVKTLSKTQWALWKKTDLGALETDLADWISRVALMYASIQADRTAKKVAFSSHESSEDRMIQLTNLYQDLGARPAVAELFVERDRLELLGEPSRRMPARLTATTSHDSVSPVLVEFIAKAYSPNLTQAEVQRIGAATAALAAVLHHSNPRQTGILACRGYFSDTSTYRYGLLYDLPSSGAGWQRIGGGGGGGGETDLMWSSDPKTRKERVLSLRELLNLTPRFPLDERLRFAADLARAVLHVHSVGWVHKSVRPDNVLFLQPRAATAEARFPYVLDSPFLAGFEYARAVTEGLHSDKKGDADWRQNVYRHPNRQGVERNEEYNMAHDVCSLGVVMLEIGLWGLRGFVPFQHEKNREVFGNKEPAGRRELLLEMTAKGLDDGKGGRYPLASSMGLRYARLVEWCLRMNEEEPIPSVVFVQKVWMQLNDMRKTLSTT